MSDLMKGFLPHYDANTGEVGQLAIEFEMPTRQLNNTAFELASSASTRGESAVLIEASLNQARLCLKRVGDREVKLRDLQGEGLNKILDPRQVETFLAGLQRLTTASEAEIIYAEASTVAVFRDGDTAAGIHRRRVKVPSSSTPREDGSFLARIFEIRLPTRNMVQRAHEAARSFEKRGPLVVASEAELNMLRMCVFAVEEEAPADAEASAERRMEEEGAGAVAPRGARREFKRVEPWSEELRGDGIDAHLSQREQSCLAQVFRRLATPDRPQVDDFLCTVVSA